MQSTNASTQVSASPTLNAKLRFYAAKYGLMRAVLSFPGRFSQRFWNIVGPRVTRGYIRSWLKEPGIRILNLGGGSNCMDGCLTVDIDARADAYVNIMKPLPFPDASIDEIFCEEVIEHIPLDAGQRLLLECIRILKPGGIIRITTPNLDWFAAQARESLKNCREINAIFYGHDHRFIYSPAALQEVVKAAGFENLLNSSYRDANSRLGHYDTHPVRFGHPPDWSQYLEARKPAHLS